MKQAHATITKDRSRAIAALITVSLFYVLLSVNARLLENGFQDLTQVYLRIMLGALVGFLVFRKHIQWKKYLTVPRTDWPGILLMGVVGYGVVVATITIGVINTSLVNASILYSTIPFFTYLYSLVVFRTKPKLYNLGLILLSFWGVSIIVSKSIIPSLTHIGKGDLFVLLSAASGAWYVIGRQMVSNYLNNRELSVLVMSIAAISTGLFALLWHETIMFSSFLQWDMLFGLAFGAALNVLATTFENYGYKILNAVFASQLLLFENVFALIIGLIMYQEDPTWFQLLGAGIVGLSVYLANKYHTTAIE